MLIPNKYNGYAADGGRTYFKGGDGGAGEARAQEEDRQRRIREGVSKINSIFDATPYDRVTNPAISYDPNATYYNEDGSQWQAPTRPEIAGYEEKAHGGRDNGNTIMAPVYQDTTDMDAINSAIQGGKLFSGKETVTPRSRDVLYNQHKDAVFKINKQDLDKQYQTASRNNNIGLARQGLLGSSMEIDSQADITERLNKGLTQSAAAADGAAADLKMQDERARSQLISSAQAGTDTGTLQGQAMRMMGSAAESAKANAGAASIGSLFGDMTQAYMNQRMLSAGAVNPYANRTGGVANVRTGDSGSVINP